MTDHLSILSTLAARTAEDACHREIVVGWLREAGFSPHLRVAELALSPPLVIAFCGTIGGFHKLQLMWNADRAVADLVLGTSRVVIESCSAPTPLEALRALVASGKVPRALLAP